MIEESRATVELLPPEAAPEAPVFPRALRDGRGDAADRLPAIPRDEAAWSALLADASTGASPMPAGYASVLARRQVELGAGDRAERNARRLGEPGTVAVVTGQQPGLLGGPLMNWQKAAAAIRHAERLDGVGGVAVVPVFWLASEDHDVLEANRLTVLARDGRPRRLSLDLPVDGRSLMHVSVPAAEAERLLGELREILPDTPRAEEALEVAAWRAGDDFATWSMRCLVGWLGDSGLVVVEPPHLLPFAGDALARLVTDGPRIREAVMAAGEALRDAGLPAPVDMAPGTLPLFLRDEPEGPRRRARIDETGMVVATGSAYRDDPAATAARLAAHPELGSGDVVGRVFVQDRLLPVLGYVGGPTEVAYHVQVRAAHEAIGLRYPLALPRPEATWVDAKAERAAAAFGFDVAEVLRLGPDAVPPRSTGGSDLERSLAAWVASAGQLPADLEAHLATGGEGPAALRRAVERVAAQAAKGAEATRAAYARDLGVGAARWQRLLDLLHPRGRAQERVLSPITLVARHGASSLQAGLKGLDPLAPGHHLVRLG